MKKSMFGLVACLALVLSLVVAQGVWAQTCNVQVSGEIIYVNPDENSITIGETKLFGVQLDYLNKKLNVILEAGENVTGTAYQCPITKKLTACTLSAPDENDVYVLINFPKTRTR
jgi:hypothetical protein